jgi:hypothetical protein
LGVSGQANTLFVSNSEILMKHLIISYAYDFDEDVHFTENEMCQQKNDNFNPYHFKELIVDSNPKMKFFQHMEIFHSLLGDVLILWWD